jgi:uncharacterized protein YerC
MSIEVNGIAHIQMTVNNIEECLPFWEKLCHFLEMKTLIKNDTTLYCIYTRPRRRLTLRTGVLFNVI